MSNSLFRPSGSRFTPFLWLLILISFHFIANFIWVSQDVCNSVALAEYNKLTALADIYSMFTDTLRSNHSLSGMLYGWGKILHNNSIGSSLPLGPETPHLIYFLSSVWMYIFGLSVVSARMSNIIYLSILIISVYYIGRKIKGPKAGLFSAFLISMYPAIFANSRGYGHDFPLTALVSASVCALIYSECFSKILPSILCGVSLGLGMLIKPQIIFFMIGPLVVIGAQIVQAWVKKRGPLKAKVFINGALVLVIALILSAFWWWNNILTVYEVFLKHFFEPRASGAAMTFIQLQTAVLNNVPLDPASKVFFYLQSTVRYIRIPFSLLFVFGLLFFVRKHSLERKILLSWVFVAYIILTLISNKYAKYFFPAFPALSLISIVGLFDWFGENRLRFHHHISRIAELFFIVFVVSQYFYFSWVYDNNEYFEIRKPKPFYSTRETVDKFSRLLAAPSGANKKIAIIRSDGIWGGDELFSMSYLLHFKLPDARIVLSFFANPKPFLDFKERFDYVIVMNYPVELEEKLFFIRKDISHLDHSFVEPPVSAIYMWRREHQEKGVTGLTFGYSRPGVWIHRQGFEDFLGRLSESSDPRPEEFRKIYKFVDDLNYYVPVADGLFQFRGLIMRVYLLQNNQAAGN